MSAQPRLRFRVIAWRASGHTYSEIATALDISEYQVGKILNDIESKAESSSPEQALLNEVIAGGADMIAYGN